jgi:hypothetical protein
MSVTSGALGAALQLSAGPVRISVQALTTTPVYLCASQITGTGATGTGMFTARRAR